MDDDDLISNGSQVLRLGFARTLGRGRQSNGLGSVLQVSREFIAASVRPVPCRPRSDTITRPHFHSSPRPATPNVFRNHAPSVTFATRRLGTSASSAAPLHSAARLSSVAWWLEARLSGLVYE